MRLEVQDLQCQRGGVTILSNVSFTVEEGEALVLRGPNGAGKTTLLRVLAGLAPPVSGTIRPGPEAIAYGAHADGLKAQMTVAENLGFWADVFGHPGIDDAVEAFSLSGLLDRRAQYLSAGQKRRLSLARLVLTGRPIWVLDEPTVSLDARNVERFAAAVGRHLDGGGAAVIATHIDLGLPGARTLDIAAFAATPEEDEAADPFLDEALS